MLSKNFLQENVVPVLYANHQFLGAVRDEATVSVACKFAGNGRFVHITSLKSSDHWISKVFYYAKCFFCGYSQMELPLQRELCRREFNIIDLLDVEREKRIAQLKKEEFLLQRQKEKISGEIFSLKQDMEGGVRELALLKEDLFGAKNQLSIIPFVTQESAVGRD